MVSTLRTVWIWFSTVTLIIVWLPLLTCIWIFDRDPVRYRTGLWFRRLGLAMTKSNPAWRLHISGSLIADPRRPYVVISNHQSLADIPIISNLPWEMKWMAKVELFKLPVVGWMLRMAGDIPVDRENRRSGAQALLKAKEYLQQKCSVMIFPEGTRSPDGCIGPFNDGAFHLAVREQVAILPIAVEGSRDCLPKRSWRFGASQDISLHLLPIIETTGLTPEGVPALRDSVRTLVLTEVARLRGVSPESVESVADSPVTTHA
jgi:1-acyl-sn-glycerol-3-phosphate acyltransferase